MLNSVLILSCMSLWVSPSSTVHHCRLKVSPPSQIFSEILFTSFIEFMKIGGFQRGIPLPPSYLSLYSGLPPFCPLSLSFHHLSRETKYFPCLSAEKGTTPGPLGPQQIPQWLVRKFFQERQNSSYRILVTSS